MIDTNWIIITGEPRSGKSTLIDRLAFEGYRICPEISRIIIDDYNSKEKELDYYTDYFEKLILKEKISAETRFKPEEYVFWDRGIIDSIAFSRLYRRNLDDEIKSSLIFHYQYIFYLDELPVYQPDYATQEDKKSASLLGKLIINAYSELGYSPINVPKMDIESRAQFILDIVQNDNAANPKLYNG